MKKSNLIKWTHDTNLRTDFKKLQAMKKSEIKNSDVLTRDVEGYAIIPSRKNYIDISEYNKNPERYENDLKALMKDIKYIVTDERYEGMYLNFTLTESDEIMAMSQIHFVFNLILWRAFFALGIPVDEEKIFMPEVFNNGAYVKYVNNKIILPYKHLTTHNEMSSLLAEMHDDIIFMCEQAGIYLGLSFSLNELFEAWDEVPELYDICHTKIPSNMQISEGEKYIARQGERMYQIFMENNDLNDTSMKALIRAGNMSAKQMREFYVHTGYKPDLDGNTIPYTGDTNLVTDGFSNMESFILDARGGRKAAVLALAISDGGYFSRLASKCCESITSHKDPEYDCGSEHYYVKKIENKSDVSTMNGRWYLDEDTNTLEQCSEEDLHLIGKTLKFRTPSKCASKEGICKVCYGHLYNQNYGINIGVNASLKISERNLTIGWQGSDSL